MTVAFDETAYAQPAGKGGERTRGDTRDIQLGGRAPTNAAGRHRVIVAAENAPRVLPGEDEVDSRLAVAMRAEAADLRQKIRRWAVLCQYYGIPSAGRVVATVHRRGAGQVPGGSDQERHRAGQARARAVGHKADLAQRRGGKVARTSARHSLLEGVIQSPKSGGLIEHKDLRALGSLRPWPIFPIAVAGIELAAVTCKNTSLGAADEMTRAISGTWREGKLKFVFVARRDWNGASRKCGASCAKNQR